MKYLDRRIEKVMESISEKDIALLITSDITRRYVYNFCSTAGFGYISSGRCELFLDFRYYEKAKNLQQCAKQIVELFDGEVPHTMKELTMLSGVGRKSANVVMTVAFDIPAIAVDTHVERVSKRLGLAKPEDSVLAVEQKLKRKLPKDRWNKAHHLFIFFGRYFCTARNPKCEQCPFKAICKKDKLDRMKKE